MCRFLGDIVAAQQQQHIWEELQKRTTWRLNFITYLTNNAYNNISEATIKEYYKQYPEDTEKAFRAYSQKLRQKKERTMKLAILVSKDQKLKKKFGCEVSTKKEGYRAAMHQIGVNR